MNKTFKKILAILTTLTMAMSLFVVAPAMAEEGEGTPALTPAEQLWIDTNLLTNGNLELGEINQGGEDGTLGNWGVLSHSGYSVEFKHSTDQAYSGDKSMLVKKSGGKGWSLLNAYTFGTSLKPKTAYIANMKILGTQKNASEGWATVTNPGTQWEDKARIFLMNGQSHVFEGASTYTDWDSYSVNTLSDAPYAGTENQTKLGKDVWKDLGMTFTTGSSLNECYGIGLGFLGYNTEFYTDDYYLGELMIAEVQNTTEASTVAIPETGDATLTLSAKALNQLGTERGLDGTTYTYKLLYPVDGVSVNGNVLTVSSDAEAGTIKVVAKANPTFDGASAQSEEIKARRRKFIDITLTKAPVATTTDIYEEVRNNTNLYKKNWGLESGQVYNLEGEGADAKFVQSSSTDVLSAKRSSNQSYSGDWSLLIKTSKSTGSYYILRDGGGNWKPGKTYVSSVMVLGTQANSALIDEEKSYPDQFKSTLVSYTAGQVASGTPLSNVGNKGAVSFKDISIAPASTSETPNSPKIGKEKWGMVYSCVEHAATGSLYNLGAGVCLSQGYSTSAEFYADDFYYGELVVANVDVQASATKVAVPESGNATVELTATAYNQLGNTEYLALDENTPYTYTIESAPAGVTVDNAGVITVPAGTEAGKINVKVTANPTFLGAADQTADQKALREKTITISVEAPTVFNFSVSNGKVTPTATINALENDAKAYCALYKVLDGGAKKLMAIISAPLTAGSTSVELDEIEIPITYDYEIKGFLWYEGTMQNVIPAVIWE